MREIVIPGEKLSDKNLKTGYGAYVKQGKIYASMHGVAIKTNDYVKVVPLRGKYMPREGDQVIGIIEGMRFKAAFVELNSAYNGYLSLEREDECHVGELIIARVIEVSNVKNVTLEGARPLYDGKLLEVQPVKIPRIIGKNGSMMKILRDTTKTTIFVGRNGRIFIKGERKQILNVEKALDMIDEQAHTHGLTARVKQFLEQEVKA
ncbi:hypothetical protein K8R43_01615 [archaeon]|nr:hypothetical protein [archaeon]